MAVSANDTPVKILITNEGKPGVAGSDGVDGQGFNNVRKTIIDNPLVWLYKKNNIVNTMKQVLFVSRATTGNYTDIYGDAQTAEPDTPREEVNGWLLTPDETHTFQVLDNIPLLSNDFTIYLKVGSYSENTTENDILLIPGVNGDLLKLGTDSSGNWVCSVLGSDLITYTANTIIPASSISNQTVIVENDSGTINIILDNTVIGSATIATGLVDQLDLDGDVTLNGDYTLNLLGYRVYDTLLNADEKTYLNE